MSDKSAVLEDARDLIEYAKSLGMTELPKGAAEGAGATPETAEAMRARAAAKKMSREEKQRALDALCDETIGDCTRCRLAEGRTTLVFGVGNPDARLLFIGEAPGRDEDRQGIPFVGRAGQLLTKIIEAMGFTREDVYIANICKCRPPQNRNPQPDEVQACIPFLLAQANIIDPEVIVCLGSVAVQNLLGTEAKISRLRGSWQEWSGIPVMPTYHPAFLLRNANMKKPVWEDMQLVMARLREKG